MRKRLICESNCSSSHYGSILTIAAKKRSLLYYTPPVSSKHFHPPMMVVRVLPRMEVLRWKMVLRKGLSGHALPEKISDFTPFEIYSVASKHLPQ